MSDLIETERSLPVSSLRSKFEAHRRSVSQSNDEQLQLQLQQQQQQALRNVSSSSDLKMAASKRAPPPPPARLNKPSSVMATGSVSSSPVASPLLRPASPFLSLPPLAKPPSQDAAPSIPSCGTVASLRSKFSSSIVITSPQPRQAVTNSAASPKVPALPRRLPSTHPSCFSSSPESTPRSISSSSLNRSLFECPISDSEISISPSPAPPPLPSRNSSTNISINTNSATPHSCASSASASSTAPSSEGESATTSCSSSSSLDDTARTRHSPAQQQQSKRPAPPPPPLRMPTVPVESSFPKSSSEVALTTATQLTPPRLPTRRNTTTVVTSVLVDAPPRLPARPNATLVHAGRCASPLPDNSTTAITPSPPPGSERKGLLHTLLPPPPTRTIGPGDKLPPARRPPTPSSDEDSGAEESPNRHKQHRQQQQQQQDPRARAVEMLPDSSRASRRPPLAACHAEPLGIHVPAYVGHVAVAGHDVVVGTQHHVRVYTLAGPHHHADPSQQPLWQFDTRELGMKDVRVSCVEFRCEGVVWIGTKEGHLFELDVRRARVLGTRPVAHAGAVTHIFRRGGAMVTMDAAGKVLIWAPEGGDLRLGPSAGTQPRVVRVQEKQDFVGLLGGWLWTSARADGVAPGGPTVRAYDLFAAGAPGPRALSTPEPVGAVTAGTELASHPGHVYLAHEGGCVSIWAMPSGTSAPPTCVEVMRVSTSDVLSLAGVHDRLWAGSRGGGIAAYDVSARPWLVTRAWAAHGTLPVLRLAVDAFSVERCGALCVVSVGRDERVRVWDGLLGHEWISRELLKQERAFSRYRELKALIVSWNIDSARPDALNTGSQANVTFLTDVLRSIDHDHDGGDGGPDIIAFGLQEVIDLESRKMAAKSMLLAQNHAGHTGNGRKKHHKHHKHDVVDWDDDDDGDGAGQELAEHVSSAYRKWNDAIVAAVRAVHGRDVAWHVQTGALVGLFSCVLVRRASARGGAGEAGMMDLTVAKVKRGMGGRHGNKGAIVTRFVIDDTSICLINVHLAAGQHHVRQRNADVAKILEDKALLPASSSPEDGPVAYAGGGDGSIVLDHEIVFVGGDMNYRIEQRRELVISAVRSGNIDTLLQHDQLTREMKLNRAFRFRHFEEGPISFAPTYKYDRRSSEYDTGPKSRTPAWCDRVLWRAHDPARVRLLHYRRYEADVSDHRPVSAGFGITVKSVDRRKRQEVRERVEARWVEEQERLLGVVRAWFVDRGML